MVYLVYFQIHILYGNEEACWAGLTYVQVLECARHFYEEDTIILILWMTKDRLTKHTTFPGLHLK